MKAGCRSRLHPGVRIPGMALLGCGNCALLLAGAVKQTAYEDVVTFRFNLGSLSTLCTLTATLDSHEEAAQSPIV